VEADGDIDLALQDADGNNAGTVSAEIRVGSKWCEIRQIVFGWTAQKFPFAATTEQKDRYGSLNSPVSSCVSIQRGIRHE